MDFWAGWSLEGCGLIGCTEQTELKLIKWLGFLQIRESVKTSWHMYAENSAKTEWGPNKVNGNREEILIVNYFFSERQLAGRRWQCHISSDVCDVVGPSFSTAVPV